MRHVFSAIAESLPPLRGIVHAAGVDGRRPLQEVDCEGFAACCVPRPPARGRCIGSPAGNRWISWFVFPRLPRLWGSKAQGSYAAANQFLDAFASYRAAQGLSTLSVQLGSLGGRRDGFRIRCATIGWRRYNYVFPGTGAASLQDVWSCQRSTAVIARVDWRRFKEVVAASARVEQLFEQSRVSRHASKLSMRRPRLAVWLRRHRRGRGPKNVTGYSSNTWPAN